MSSKRKFNRKSKYTLSQKIISAVTAAGFIMQPFTAFAGEIVKPGGENLIKDNVANIWADRVVDKTAINVFNKFNLSQNEIANMYFGLKDTKHDAANLVNFVNDRIDINGTVNAIQNKQIGGNLFFLSKDGMAVGKSGVINTGSLYVMTPTPDFMEAVQTVGTEAPAEDANKYLGYITNITDPTKANAWEIIPVNTSGTITVLGKVNATNEVQMRAAKIGVGKNVSGELTDDEGTVIMEANADNKEAYIKTGVTNFNNIVNTEGMDISDVVLEVSVPDEATGNIVLSAYVDGATEKNDLEELPVVGATLGPIAETVENTFVEQDFNASVDVYGTVATGVETTEKKGDININATAVNSNAAVDEYGNYIDNKNTDVAQLANVKAEVNIGGTVNAAEDVTVKAEAINRYIDNSGAVAKAVSVGVSSGTPITGDVAYSVLNTEANVNITSDGSIKSGKGVDIDAKAETLAASAASVTALKFKAAGGTTGANVPAVSVLYTNAVNKANVTVEGNINAAEGNINAAENISIDADADMKVDAENKMGIKGKMGNQFVVGVTVAGAENSASVDIKDEDNSNNVINAGNDLSVNANATSDFTSGTSIKAPEASAMAVAVNVTDFNSNANVNIDTDLTTGNDLTVKADNIITDDNVIAESTIGSGKYVSAATQVVTGHVEQKKGEVKEFISGLAAVLGKGKKLPIGDDDDIPGLQLSEIFKAGATVTYSGQKHDSSVTIGKNASLNANDGKLDIGALTKIEDAHITATGTTSSYNDDYPAELTVNAAVLVNNMDNSSSVVVADRDAESTEPTLNGKNGVSVNASTRFEYNRIKNMIQDVKDAANQIASAVGGLDGSIENDFNGFINTLNKQISTWEIAFSTADETLATSDNGVLAIGEAAVAGYNVLTALNNLNTMLDNSGSEVAADTKAAIQGASDLLTSALAFADPNSYGNFAASSASKGSSGDTGSIAGHHSSAVNGAGTVMVNTVNSVSKVEIGSNAVINADGKVELNAENYMKDVSLGGLNAVPLTNSGGGTAASIGATVNYSDFNTDTVVAVNDGAEISGGDINIAGSNEIDHVSVAGSAGMGPSDENESNGIVLNGMLSFVDGSSDILTVVDDGAKLTADAQKPYTETVKDEETGEETEETKTSEGSISISGHNDTNIVNVAAGLNLGSGSGAVGVGLAYNDFAVKNIAGVADVAEQIEGLYGTGTGDVTFANKYNKETAKDNEGGISAYGFDVDAATEGSIQSVSVAASASKNDDTGEVSFFGKIKGGISNVEKTLLDNGGKLDQVTGKIFGTESGKANDFFNMGSKTHGANGDGIKIEGGTSGKGGFMPSFSIAGSGSVSLNVLDNATEAIVDNAKITMNDGDINVTARDALYAGAYSGAAALQWKSGGSSSDKAVGFAGAAGVNDIDNVVKAVVKNSTITNAGEFNTMALSGGEQLALGLGLAVEKTGSTSGYSGNAAVSVNLIDHEVEALHENNTVEKADDVNVFAYARDIENTGGGSLGAGQQKVGVGATVGVAMLNNNISAGIKGGSYNNVGNVDVEALNALKNITVGIAAGLTVPSGGNSASATVEGAGVYNEVHNTTDAFIAGNSENDKVNISTVDGGSVNVTAQDVAIEDDIYEQTLTDGLTDGKAEIAKRMGDDFDITGESDLGTIDTSAAKNELGEDVSLDKSGGSSIITVAGGLAATTGKGAGGAAVAITDIENNYTANIDYANITTETLKAYADSSSNIVTVAGGIAAASKGSGVGSVSWNDVDNTAKANIKNSVVKAQDTDVTAKNAAQIVSVGGQISVGGKAGVGAVLSYIGLDNSTEANIVNTNFDKRADEETEGTSVTADVQNTSDSYNIGAGVSAAGTAAVSGTVVVTQTHGTAGAVMDKVTIDNAKAVTANALDDTDILSVIGTVAAAGTAAVGGGVAYTEIGDVSTDPANGQYVTAEIKNNSTINTAGAESTVDVKAKDEARVINVAVGVGGAGTVAVQGASATSLINKTTSAEIENTDIDAAETDSKNVNVTVEAQNVSEITGSADVAAVAGSGAGVGAGISVNRIIQQTNASVNGGTMNVNDITVKANAAPQITNIGIGIGVGGSGAGVTGSVAVNMIDNTVNAHIGNGADITADNNVGVIATSDEQIANYAGNASVAGTGAAVGLSVSYNELTGSTTSTIDGDTTSVSASGKGEALMVKDGIADGAILNNFVDEDAFDSQDNLGNDRVANKYKGVAVSASSTHTIKSFLVNGGVGGTGAAVNGTVNVNQIGGSTKAAITGADINTVGNASDVNVAAHDYTNSAGLVGTMGIAGVGAGVGLGSDTNTVSREVTAEVFGKADEKKTQNTINAADFNVNADAKQGISSLTVSLAAAGVGGGVSNATSVALLNGSTTAKVNNANITAGSVNVAANHTGNISTMGNVLGAAGVGGGVGVGVSVLNEDSTTAAELRDSNIKIVNDEQSSDNDINVTAANNTNVNYQLYSVGIGLAGVAGAIGVSNVNSKVNTNVENVDMDSSKADDINIGAVNSINFTNNSGSGGGGAVGAGVGVAVNTIDSQVTTTVTNAQLNAANDINVTAQETRKVNQMTVNAGAGLVAGGANVMITNVGSAVADSYGSGLQTDNDGQVQDNSGINTATIFDKANEAVEGNKLKDGDTYGVQVNNVPDVKATKGTDGASVVEVNINESTLNAGNKVTAEAVADTNVTMNTVQASGAAVISATGTVGILDVNRNSVVNINNTTINAKDLAVSTTQKGTSNLSIYQGNVGGAGSIGAAYGSASSTGVNNISVSGSTLNVDSNVDINANDESKTAVDAFGVTLAGGGAASIIVAQGSNNSSTNIDVNDTDIYAGEDIDIHAERQAKDEKGNKVDSLSVSAKAMSGGLMFAGAGVGATANELGKVGVTVADDSNFTAGSDINITALNAPSVSATTGSLSASMVASGAITVAEANIGKHIGPEDKENENKDDNGHLKTFVNIGDGNSFTAKSLTAQAKADAVQNVTMEGMSISAALWPTGSVQANTGGANAYSDVTVTVGENVFKDNGNDENAEGIDLIIKGINNVTQTASAKGISVSTFFASGTNIAQTNSVLNTNVTVDGEANRSNVDDDTKYINNVDISAESTANINNSSRGDGGAVVDVSPYAAMTENDINSTTNVTVNGTWNIAGYMTVGALHENNININTDALKAAVVGLSGVYSDNKIINNTSVNFNNANVTTTGNQKISACNDIDYTADIQGSGYGVASGAAVLAQDEITSNANVNVTGSQLKADGSITMDALTGDANYDGVEKPKAAIDKNVTIKSAGVVAGTYAESTDTINFTNNINIGKDSIIKTTGTEVDNADITLTAADRTNFTDIVTADTQGGVIGAAGTKLDNNITKTNNITVGGMVDSNYDANFDVGDTSVLNLTLKSNAYNKTAAPLATNPSISGVVNQNSAIDFEAGSSVRSLRNINAAAGAGDTTIAKESKTWRWVDGGETGTGSIASTSDGTLSGGDAVINTIVTVDGSLEAGKNNELKITINSSDEQKAALDQAINAYGTALGSDKDFEIFIENVNEAQNAYNEYLEESGLNDLYEQRDELPSEYDLNTICKELENGVIKITNDLHTAESIRDQAQTAVDNAITKKDLWITEALADYKKEHDWAVGIDEDTFEKTLEAGLNTYGKENLEAYNKHTANIESCKSTLKEKQDIVDNLGTVLTNKERELEGYTEKLAQVSDLNDAINEILAKQEYKDVLDNLKDAQDDYNEALEDGVSAERVNGVIFKKGQEGDYLSVSYGEGSEWYKQYYGSPLENVGMADYAAGLLTRYNEIIDMMQNYTGTDISQVYSAELSRIQSELQTLGIGYTDKATGTFVVATGVSTVPTIELKDLMVSGGNVNISAGTLTSEKGSGSITAHGKPIVSITNNTDFFLHVNDVVIDSDGGKVLHNNVAIDKHDKIAITSEPGDSAGNNGQITIQNTTITTAADSNIYTPDIGIYGTISNPFGNVTINNENNSIYVAGEIKAEDGKVTQEAGSIKGRTINLEAGGAITQGYSDEIRNAGGSPEDAIEDELLTAIQEALINNDDIKDKSADGKYYTAFEDKDDLIAFLMTIEVNGEPLTEVKAEAAANALTGQIENSTDSGIKAGGAIYINAASINVNGIIQSGFEDYKLAINADKEINGQTLQELINSYNKDASVVEMNYDKYMNDTYLVTDGTSGAVYENGKFVYNIKAWYNPETNEIFTEHIDQAGGGRIYLTGAIANTNNSGGKLVVLDGGSKYTIDGTVEKTNDFTFKLGSINADTVTGRIEINDTNTGNKVVYSRIIDEDGKLKTVITTTDADNNDSVVKKDANASITYDPIDGLYYNWSNGTSSRVVTTYQHVTDSSWFGLDKNEWQSELSQSEKDSMRLDQQTFDGLMTDKNGEIIAGSVINNGTISTDYDYIEVDGKVGEKTEVVSSGKTGNNLYQISFQRKGKPKQAVDGNNKPLYWTMDENGTKVNTTEAMTNGVANEPIYATDSEGNIIYETEVSEMTTTTKKKGLFGLWGKTVTTTWKETSGVITSYNFGTKADNPINIEFVGNKNGSAGTIKSNSDILLGGDIHMGQVDITSTAGKIYHEGDATVISDNASFKAYDDIDVIQKNVNEALRLKAESTNGGDINIQAIASNANNMVYIDNVSTAGNVNITAEGSLLTEKGDAVVLTGNGITLQSYGGGIDLVIDGGTEGTNAYAVDDISLTEANGNMYLGEIVAEDGDVVLKVTGEDAGFVDAIKNNNVMSESDQDRINSWKELGLLGGTGENVNSRENQKDILTDTALSGNFFMDGEISVEDAMDKGVDLLAKGDEFVDLMKGGAQEVQNAKAALDNAQGILNEAIADLNDKKDDSEAAYKTALKKYNEAYDHYAQVGAKYEQDKANFIENSVFADNEQAVNWLYNYEAIGNAEADNYGWTQQQLLYAVQDTVINPNAGSVSDVKTANVTGNNITFISHTGNLGVVDTQATTIGTDELTAMFTKKGALTADEQEKLDKLASARAGDVTWGAENITIERTTPVSIKLNKNSDGKTTGTVTVQSKDGVTTDHIYLLAKDSVLNADEFVANDLRLSGQDGLNVGSVTGEKIYLEGGSGNINSLYDAEKAVQVTLKDTTDTTGKVINGFISANAAGNVALQQAADNNVDFTLGSVAGTNVNITANGDIVSRTDDISYINASKTITLTSDGGIGTSDKGLRIKNSGAVVNTNVQSAINIEAKQDGTLILGTMKQADGGVNVDSEGSIYIGREDDESLDAYIDAKGDVNLHAAEDIIINGKLHVKATDDGSASDGGNLNLHADNGDIIQTTETKEDNIVAANVGIAAIGGNVELANEHNIIKNVDIQAVGGSLGLAVSNPDGFNVDMGGFTNKLGGDVSFTNSDGSVNITTQDITDPKKQDEANINGSLTVIAKKGDKATVADINNEGILNATDTIKFTATDGVINSDTVNGKDVIMQAIEQELENIIAKDSVTLNGDRIHGYNITQNKDAGGDLIINTDSNKGNGPIESLVIDKIDANDKSVFTDLWAVNADITTADDKMDFNKILIEEMAWLKNTGTLATVYGNIPVKDDDANVHIYQAYPSMFINFVDADTVETDGRLLSLDNYWYAYDQRFTAEDHMRWHRLMATAYRCTTVTA